MFKFERILNCGYLYNLFQRLVEKPQIPKELGVFSTVSLNKDNGKIRVLDIGCGPGTRTHHFLDSDTEYFGFDLNPQNIAQAKRRYSRHPNICFICQDINTWAMMDESEKKFDLVLMHGILHHICDKDAQNCLSAITLVLKKEGIVRFEDTLNDPEASKISKWLASHDRGKYVRTEKEYKDLIYPYMPNLTCRIVRNALRIPFSRIYIQARL